MTDDEIQALQARLAELEATVAEVQAIDHVKRLLLDEAIEAAARVADGYPNGQDIAAAIRKLKGKQE